MYIPIPSLQMDDPEPEDKKPQAPKGPTLMPARTRIYNYLEALDILPGNQQEKAYNNITNNFLKKSGIRIKDIEACTLSNIYCFGVDNALFEEDKLLLVDWCRGIITMKTKFEHRRFIQQQE